MFTDRYNPFVHRPDLIGFTRPLQGTVICHDPMLTVKFRLIRKQLHVVAGQIRIGVLVSNHINRISQNSPNSKPSKLIVSLGAVLPLHKELVCLGQRIRFHKLIIDHLDQLHLIGNDLQLTCLSHLAVHRHMGGAFRFISRRRYPAQPATGFRQLVHIILDSLCDCLTLQLRKNRRHIHHGASHRRGGIELLPNGDEVDFSAAEILDELGEVPDIAADTVQPVHHDGLELHLAGVLHHLLKLRALQRSAGKALVLVHQRRLRLLPTEMGGNILTAQLDLVLDALAFACKF